MPENHAKRPSRSLGYDKWMGHLTELLGAPTTKVLSNGMIKATKKIARTDCKGFFEMGITLSPKTDGTFDLVTVLTRQTDKNYFSKFPVLKVLPAGKGVSK